MTLTPTARWVTRMPPRADKVHLANINHRHLFMPPQLHHLPRTGPIPFLHVHDGICYPGPRLPAEVAFSDSAAGQRSNRPLCHEVTLCAHTTRLHPDAWRKRATLDAHTFRTGSERKHSRHQHRLQDSGGASTLCRHRACLAKGCTRSQPEARGTGRETADFPGCMLPCSQATAEEGTLPRWRCNRVNKMVDSQLPCTWH